MPATRRATLSVPTSRYGAVVLQSNTDRIRGFTGSGSNVGVFNAAGAVANYVAGGEINPDLARAQLVAAATTVLPFSEAHRVVDRGLRYGTQHPKAAPNRPRVVGRFHATQEATRWLQAVMASRALDPTTKSILYAIGQACIRHGRYETSLSHRQLAEHAGTALSTVTRHTPMLDRWVLRRSPTNPEHGTIWRLRLTHPDVSTLASIPEGNPAANYWHRRASWWQLYHLLDEHEPVSPRDLARRCGRSVGTVYRIVKRLVADGLVACREGQITKIPGAQLPDTEVDWAARRENRHATQRRLWQRYRERLREDRVIARGLPLKERAAFWAARRAARQTRRLRERARSWEHRSGKAGVALPDTCDIIRS